MAQITNKKIKFNFKQWALRFLMPLGVWALCFFLLNATASYGQQVAPSPSAAAEGPAKSRVSISGKAMHVSANRSLRDLAKNRLELFGNVYIRRPQELLTSDYAVLDLKTENLIAEGNVVYFTSETVIYGSRMNLNLTTNTGTIEDGRVESDKYQLLGQHLQRLGPDEFFATDSDYTTCRDCPSSWKIHGDTIRLTVQGYARISNMLIKINDAPVFYFPYLIIPVKTRRQSGFLFPKFRSSSQNGFQFVQPYFWAISRSMDATVAFGRYTAKGYKAEGEFRYSLGPRTNGQLNVFGLQDRSFIEPYQKRWALEGSGNTALPFKFDLKLHWLDASDRDYARLFPEDIPGGLDAALVSEAGLSRSDRNLSGYISAQRIKKTLRPELTGFDSQTVQPLPRLDLASSDHQLLEWIPLYWGTHFNYTKFWRLGTSFDTLQPPNDPIPSLPGQYVPGRDPLRRAERFILTPEIYYTSRIFDVIEFVPSAQYRAFFYTFDKDVAGTTRRGYLVAQAELATTVEKIYGDSLKHKIRPSLTYSNIPFIQQNNEHPFIKQINFSGGTLFTGATGRQFDDYDIVPVSSDVPQYFIPVGNSLTYKLTNSFILKSRGELGNWEFPNDMAVPAYPISEQPVYDKVLDISSGQTINFIEFRKSEGDIRPLSRAFTLASLTTRRVKSNSEVYFYPYRRAYQVSTGLEFFLQRYTKRLLKFERSFNISYSRNKVTSNAHNVSAGINWSVNDYFSFGISRSYDLLTRQALSTLGRLVYQSPSQCFQIMLTIQQTLDRGFEVSPNFVINLSGEGFMNVADPGSVSSASSSSTR